MKLYTAVLSLIFVMIFQCYCVSQILNAGFENWTNGDPNDWDTSDNGNLNAVSQSTDFHSGSSAARLEIIENSAGGPFGPYMASGEKQEGFPVSEKYFSLTGFYKFFPVGNDVVGIIIEMVGNSSLVGGGTSFLGAVSSYTQFAVPINYTSESTPELARISILVSDSSSGGTLGIGSYALIDDLSFGGPTDVKLKNPIASSFSLQQNYPNPFNPSTKINFTISEQSYVKLIVYDILGNEITNLANGDYTPGEYSVDFEAGSLSGGIYFAKLSAGKYSNTIKMVVVK